MKRFKMSPLSAALTVMLLGGMGTAGAVVNVQCPCDNNGDADCTDPGETPIPGTVCMHLVSGDGYSRMVDGNALYTFGFADKTGVAPEDVIADGILAARFPGPTIELNEGDQFYLSLSNVGTVMRPDLFDPHTVHFHGFPNASAVFDGVPEVSISINHGATLTYFYNIVEPGTYLYHCHVEATEHMEMGMLANLFVHPAQDGTPIVDASNGQTYSTFTYNDGDGTTGYDVEKAIQLSSFDTEFHDASAFVEPLPFAHLHGDYPMFNGRGYPDTIKIGNMKKALDTSVEFPRFTPEGEPTGESHPVGKFTGTPNAILNNGELSNELDSLVESTQGDRILLRLSNVGLDRFWTLSAPGLTLKVVGRDARQMKGSDGKLIYTETSAVYFGGGEVIDVLIDTADVEPGTYLLHANEVHQNSSQTTIDGGMVTEIVVNAPI